mmetsp:Transcript_4154/g.7414  ORF Transcript_4154/g.7414 Transcript_4154/m.7414 type:complete len:251 (-) Transcript_4154:579-1331(-)
MSSSSLPPEATALLLPLPLPDRTTGDRVKSDLEIDRSRLVFRRDERRSLSLILAGLLISVTLVAVKLVEIIVLVVMLLLILSLLQLLSLLSSIFPCSNDDDGLLVKIPFPVDGPAIPLPSLEQVSASLPFRSKSASSLLRSVGCNPLAAAISVLGSPPSPMRPSGLLMRLLRCLKAAFRGPLKEEEEEVVTLGLETTSDVLMSKEAIVAILDVNSGTIASKDDCCCRFNWSSCCRSSNCTLCEYSWMCCC